MKTKNIWKEAGVLLIASFLVMTTVVTADTETFEIESSIVTNVTAINKFIGEISPIGDVVWDNGMEYEGLLAAQEPSSPANLDGYPADDFIFDVDTEVCDVHWIGGYYGGDPEPWDWCILFYYDRGDGNAPGNVFLGKFCYAWDEINKEELGNGYYEMWVDLPENYVFPGDTKFWISIWAVGDHFPQSGWGYHQDPITLHEAVFKSDWWNISDWTDTSLLLGYPIDMCFQLTTKGEPIPDLDCDGSLVWTEVKPGATVTGDFALGNIGDAGSTLNWKVKEYPTWGTWTFNPPNGAQPVGWIMVNVTVIAPNEKEQNFTGDVILENIDDPTDICKIEVLLSTPKTKGFNFYTNIINWLLEQFPILKFILGL